MNINILMLASVGLGAALVSSPTRSIGVAQAAESGPVSYSELDWMHGRWRGGGRMFESGSHSTLEVQPSLDGKFLELTYQATGTDESKPFRFEGRAFYKPLGGGKWEAWWFDSQGASLPIAATSSEEQLSAIWGNASSQRGRTVYRRLSDGQLEVVDSALQKDGSWREFARQKLEKAD